MNRCPRCTTALDEGPIIYRCSTCRRAVYAADLNLEYVPRTHAPCDCPEFGTPEYYALLDKRHGAGA